jgi:hypothetical protein
MHRKIVSILVASLFATGVASAQEVGVTTNVNANAALGVAKVNVGATTTVTTNTRGNATSSAKKDNEAKTTKTETTSVTTESKRSSTGEAHMSAVAVFVQSLLSIANREGGIGTQVRAVAQAQNDTASTTAAAITAIEARGKLRTFLFGTDYKSIGQLRSDVTVTENSIAQLKAVLDKALSVTTKAELTTQLKALEDTQVKLNAYIKANESSFSLFGWLNK